MPMKIEFLLALLFQFNQFLLLQPRDSTSRILVFYTLFLKLSFPLKVSFLFRTSCICYLQAFYRQILINYPYYYLFFINFNASSIKDSALFLFGESAIILNISASVFDTLNQINELSLKNIFNLPSSDSLILQFFLM